jgi:hypothetical protein
MASVRERNIPTERQPLVGEVSANSFGWGCHNKYLIYIERKVGH